MATEKKKRHCKQLICSREIKTDKVLIKEETEYTESKEFLEEPGNKGKFKQILYIIFDFIVIAFKKIYMS